MITDFNRSDIMFIDRENKTAVVVNIAVTLNYKLSNTEGEKITKYENLTLKIKISGNLTTYLYTPQSSQRKEWSAKNF